MSSPSRTAIVTGAANGIGRAIALRLADDGFNIAICDLPSQEEAMKSLVTEIETKGRKVHAGVVNVSIEQQVNDFISTVVAQLGGLDVVRVMFFFCFVFFSDFSPWESRWWPMRVWLSSIRSLQVSVDDGIIYGS